MEYRALRNVELWNCWDQDKDFKRKLMDNPLSSILKLNKYDLIYQIQVNRYCQSCLQLEIPLLPGGESHRSDCRRQSSGVTEVGPAKTPTGAGLT